VFAVMTRVIMRRCGFLRQRAQGRTLKDTDAGR
jgi:hypothetical protein